MPQPLTVVAALIIEEGKVLLTQRMEGTHLALHWEFPGGKVEPGESPPAALARELREELGVEAGIGEPFAFNWHDYGEKQVLLLAYRARIERGEPRPLGVRDLRWCDAQAVRSLPMPPADGPILERLLPLLTGS
ncbi:MAG TPA: (deoxy)nucleoside triphosphate pyrophosphohydrolase [Candidatus Saccharimonadales bacterium]|nr:(deoxy)nucleoside triphosphate pyrophosphohydrolase [Candidatus Saccharimonadales bacterium]